MNTIGTSLAITDTGSPGTNSIWFGLETPDEARSAYHWHRGFGSANTHIAPREWAKFKNLVDAGHLIAAKDFRGDYIGLAYFYYKQPDWIVGGLMVSDEFRRRGVGLVMVCLTLGHLLILEDPLARGERVVAYVAGSNSNPLFLADALAFRGTGQTRHRRIRIDMQESAENADGFREFELTVPATLRALAQWFGGMNGKLPDNTPIEIELLPILDIQKWSGHLEKMANRP